MVKPPECVNPQAKSDATLRERVLKLLDWKPRKPAKGP